MAGRRCSTSSAGSAALAAHGVDVPAYLGTRPVTARLPWDHIDVGLEDGFLLGEYRKALKGRASPPCGKVAGMLIHHTNLADAEPDHRKLVCYDCGVACDLSKMRDDRLVALRALGAERAPAPAGEAVAVDAALPALVDVSERGGGSPAEHATLRSTAASARRGAATIATRGDVTHRVVPPRARSTRTPRSRSTGRPSAPSVCGSTAITAPVRRTRRIASGSPRSAARRSSATSIWCGCSRAASGAPTCRSR